MFQLYLTTNTSIPEEERLQTDHEAAVQDALHIAVKNHSVNQEIIQQESPTTSSVTESSCKAATKCSHSRRVRFLEGGHKSQDFERYSEDECLEVWFQFDDYHEMKRAYAFTVFMMDAGCPEKVEDDVNTCRGLERRSEEGQWKRFERKRQYYNAVLDEQDRQWQNDEDDQERIALAGNSCTMGSSMDAYEMGVKDELTVYGESRTSRYEHQQEAEDDTSTALTASTRSNSSSGSGSSEDNDSWQTEDDCYTEVDY